MVANHCAYLSIPSSYSDGGQISYLFVGSETPEAPATNQVATCTEDLQCICKVCGSGYGESGCDSRPPPSPPPPYPPAPPFVMGECPVLPAPLHIPEGITDIPANAYNDCGTITELTLPSTLISIGSGAFWASPDQDQVHSWPGLVIPANVETIGAQAFRQRILDGPLSIMPYPETTSKIKDIEPYAFEMLQLSGSLTIPGCVGRIQAGAFRMLNWGWGSWPHGPPLGSLTLGEGIEHINKDAFKYSRFAGELHLPTSIKSIGKEAFYRDPSDTVGFSGSLTIGVDYSGSWTLVDGVTRFMKRSGSYNVGCVMYCSNNWLEISLYNNDWLNGIVIGYQAFHKAGFDGGTLTLGQVEVIGARAFTSTGFVGNVVVPSSVKAIGENAFGGAAMAAVLSVSLPYPPPNTLPEMVRFSINGIPTDYYPPGGTFWEETSGYDAGAWIHDTLANMANAGVLKYPVCHELCNSLHCLDYNHPNFQGYAGSGCTLIEMVV